MGRATLEDVRVEGDPASTFVEPLSFDGRAILLFSNNEGRLADDEIRFSRRLGTDDPTPSWLIARAWRARCPVRSPSRTRHWPTMYD